MRDFIAGKTIQNAATPCSRDEPSDASKGISIGGKSIVQNGNSNQIPVPVPVKGSSIALCRVQQGNGKNTSGDQRPDQSTTSTTSRQIISTSTKSSHRTIANPYMKNPYSTSNIGHENRSGLDLQHSSNQTMLQDPNPDMARSKSHPPPVSRQANAPNSGGVRLNQHRKETQSRMINPYAKNAASSLQETATSTNNAPRNNSSQNKATAVNGNGNQRPHELHTGVRPVSNINEMRSISDINVNVGRRTIREPIVANPFTANATNIATAKDDNTKRLQARSIKNSGNSQTSQLQQVAPHTIISDPSQQRLQNMGFQGQNSANNVNVVERNFVLRGYQPGRVPLVLGELQKTWIYPKGDKFGEREYQLAISRSAILHNTLVSLPTGLGKTLIAAVVMYNFYRWFPTGKVVFLAPTRPLVRQQIEACYNIMGIPELHTAEISGSVKDRERLWRTRRVFFCTPQAFERDIENGLCDINLVVCLVLDEAHKTTKKYAYNVVVQRLRNAKVNARIVSVNSAYRSRSATYK
jgi:Fanconi anemia group M protein